MNEQQLHQLIKTKLVPDIIRLGEFDASDAYSRRYNQHYEYKCISKSHPRIMLEKQKYDDIINLPNIRYVISIPTGIWSFNLQTLPPFEWQEIYVHHSTFYNREVDYINKTCTFLPLGWGRNISHLLLD
jgi:hypothetical protein